MMNSGREILSDENHPFFRSADCCKFLVPATFRVRLCSKIQNLIYRISALTERYGIIRFSFFPAKLKD